MDTSLPKIDDHQTTEENFLQVTNYLYMLLENLKYTLGNLGEDNFNDSELDSIGRWIREPVMVRLEDADGRIANLDIEAARLAARLEDAEGNISSISSTASGWYARIEDAEGNISALNASSQLLSSQISSLSGDVSNVQQTANSLITKVQDVEGNVSTLTQTANSLSSKITSAEGNISSLTQTVNGMTLSVSNSGTSSTIKLMQNGVAISSQSIVMSGVVTFSDLSTAGSTTINGSNITTGSINASLIKSGSINANLITTGTLSSDYIRLYNSLAVYSGSSIAGYIGYTTSANDGSAGMHMKKGNGEIVVTANGAKLTYAGTTNQVYISNGGAGITVSGYKYNFLTGEFRNDNEALLGTKTQLWGQIYSTNATISTSDRNKKHDIEDLDGRYVKLFDALRARRFKLNNGTSNRYHPGFVAQEVEEALVFVGLDSQEFGGFVKDKDDDGNDLYFLRYEEFIAILAAKIKQLEERIA